MVVPRGAAVCLARVERVHPRAVGRLPRGKGLLTRDAQLDDPFVGAARGAREQRRPKVPFPVALGSEPGLEDLVVCEVVFLYVRLAQLEAYRKHPEFEDFVRRDCYLCQWKRLHCYVSLKCGAVHHGHTLPASESLEFFVCVVIVIAVAVVVIAGGDVPIVFMTITVAVITTATATATTTNYYH